MLVALQSAQAGVIVTLPSSDREVEFDDSAAGEVQGAVDDLAARRFDDAARRFAALADAGHSADLRYLEAIARYEGGDLRSAATAATAGLAIAPSHVELMSLDGLILADLGRGDDAIAILDKALATSPPDDDHARIVLNRGIVHLDRGEATLAETDFRDARATAEKAGVADVVALADQDLTLVASLRGEAGATDTLGAVGDKLRTGDVAGARAAIPKPPADRRGRVQVLIASGTVARAEGHLDDAVASLEEAQGLAKEGGLLREQASALAELGIVYGIAGKYALAIDRLQEAIGLVKGTSFRVNELAYRIEAGRMAVRTDDLAQASSQLEVARALAKSVEDPLGVARISELEGLVAARKGDAAIAGRALDTATSAFETHGDWAEAARIATEAVEAYAGKDVTALGTARERALGLFAQAKDPLGAAHVGVAEGLGRARHGDPDGALAAFAAAATAAEAVKTARGTQVAEVAREDAAQTLILLGRSPEVAEKSKQYGLDTIIAQHATFDKAEKSYDAARAAYDQGQYAQARDGFDSAYKGLQGLGETGYALKARRGRAWATYNATIGQTPASALPIWQGLIEEAVQIQDPELRARAMGAEALDAADLKHPEALVSLRAAADEAEKLGLATLAGQVQARRATLEPSLDDRLAAARRAWSLRPDSVGVYAMYAVAVDLYNADRFTEAVQIADDILPSAGKLTAEVQKVRDASRAASGG